MSLPFYHFRTLPPGLFDQSKPEPFRHALHRWQKFGLGPVVDRVTGNGILVPLDSGGQMLCVWPEGHEYPGTIGDDTRVVIDDELTVTWSGHTPPGPDDLDNGNPLRLGTVPVILCDGNAWQIPEIREPRGSLLPTDLVRDRKSGRLLNPIKKEYEQLWSEAEYWFDLKWKHLQGEASSFSLTRALAFATQIISLRYRFCDATQTALRVIDSVNVQMIIETAIGWPAVIEHVRAMLGTDDEDQKKSQPASPVNANGSSGPEASVPSTAQPAASNGSPPSVKNGSEPDPVSRNNSSTG